jgi:hypothetical protein
VEVLHLSPSRNRVSIQREGLRRMSMHRKKLVSYVYLLRMSPEDVAGLADLHDTTEEYIDTWCLRVSGADLWNVRRNVGMLVVDVAPENICVLHAAKMEG